MAVIKRQHKDKAVLIWSIDRFKQEIEQQIEVGRGLLSEEIPFVLNPYGISPRQEKTYDKSLLNAYEQKMQRWKDKVKDILLAAFGGVRTRYFNDFANIETDDMASMYCDTLEMDKEEISDRINALESIIERTPYIPVEETNVDVCPKVKTKKVFISHSHEDEVLAKALVDLLHDIGFEYSEIFCSSVPACSIPEGGNIFEEIRNQFEKHDLFVIFIHSPRLYGSLVSMNEMGAAWVLRSDYSSFLTKDFTTNDMQAVVRNENIVVKIGDKNAKYVLNSWKDRILKFFNKPDVSLNAWEQDKDKFLKIVTDIEYPQAVSVKTEEAKTGKKETRLSENDEALLKEWVESGDIDMYNAEYMGGGEIILGNVSYPYSTAREEAQWDAFFKRLLANGFIESTGMGGNSARYKLTEKAYTYFEK